MSHSSAPKIRAAIEHMNGDKVPEDPFEKKLFLTLSDMSSRIEQLAERVDGLSAQVAANGQKALDASHAGHNLAIELGTVLGELRSDLRVLEGAIVRAGADALRAVELAHQVCERYEHLTKAAQNERPSEPATPDSKRDADTDPSELEPT
jgi:hypothetical protein